MSLTSRVQGGQNETLSQEQNYGVLMKESQDVKLTHMIVQPTGPFDITKGIIEAGVSDYLKVHGFIYV